ncbi:hypothetical protein [Pseudomonas sp.]|uniref:hypothetical protein n=1 Tax=Pseudomonas sp. TaxID=306 RepID=UPI002FC63437
MLGRDFSNRKLFIPENESDSRDIPRHRSSANLQNLHRQTQSTSSEIIKILNISLQTNFANKITSYINRIFIAKHYKNPPVGFRNRCKKTEIDATENAPFKERSAWVGSCHSRLPAFGKPPANSPSYSQGDLTASLLRQHQVALLLGRTATMNFG